MKLITTALLALLASLALALTPFPSKSIDAHYMPGFSAATSPATIAGLRSYPLPGLVAAGGNAQAADVLNASQAGIDGFNVDLIWGNNANAFNGLLIQARNVPGFHVEPTLDFSGSSPPTAAQTVAWVQSLILNADTSCWGTIGGKYVVWCYNGAAAQNGGANALAFWTAVTRALPNVQFIVDDLWILQNPGTLGCAGQAQQYVQIGVMLYAFTPLAQAFTREQSVQAVMPMAVGSATPGYWRIQSSNGVLTNYVNPGGSDGFGVLDRFLSYWQTQKIRILEVTSWNDCAEAHDMQPSCTWGWARAKHLAAWAAAWRAMAMLSVKNSALFHTPKLMAA